MQHCQHLSSCFDFNFLLLHGPVTFVLNPDLVMTKDRVLARTLKPGDGECSQPNRQAGACYQTAIGILWRLGR